MPDDKPLRRPAFDEIANGWGGDKLDDLLARAQLLHEWWAENFPLQPAELKVARAIIKRLTDLGGVTPITFQ